MQFLEEEIRQVAEAIWASVLGVNLVPRTVVPPVSDGAVSAWVQLSGGFEGAVNVECSAEFARHAAATMFGLEPAAASLADTRDAIGELTNMTGGNLKALLPESCRLSLPTVVERGRGCDEARGGSALTTVAFDCQGTPLVIRLLGRANTEGGRHA
jgi:chemotaxis protein CheX